MISEKSVLTRQRRTAEEEHIQKTAVGNSFRISDLLNLTTA